MGRGEWGVAYHPQSCHRACWEGLAVIVFWEGKRGWGDTSGGVGSHRELGGGEGAGMDLF